MTTRPPKLTMAFTEANLDVPEWPNGKDEDGYIHECALGIGQIGCIGAVEEETTYKSRRHKSEDCSVHTLGSGMSCGVKKCI
jgi:hypothetical protein